MCGAAGIWAPSCISCAQVAVDQLNQGHGIDGRHVQLVMIDAAEEAGEPVEEIVRELIENEAIDAIVGMHISAVRQRLSKVVRNRIPYIYTPLYEGGESTPGIFAIGETPQEQLGPAISALQLKYQVKKWALIGNDYIWPRSSHSYAKSCFKDLGTGLAMERYIPFGTTDMSGLMDQLEASGSDAALISLVGQDGVNFNREFGRRGLHRSIVRLSSALEENGLIACGPKNVERLFAVSAYFGSVSSAANAGFKERYYSLHGDTAPLLNSLGQSTYEGLHYLAALLREFGDVWRERSTRDALPVFHESGRNYPKSSPRRRPAIYLARADGLQFRDFRAL